MASSYVSTRIDLSPLSGRGDTMPYRSIACNRAQALLYPISMRRLCDHFEAADSCHDNVCGDSPILRPNCLVQPNSQCSRSWLFLIIIILYSRRKTSSLSPFHIAISMPKHFTHGKRLRSQTIVQQSATMVIKMTATPQPSFSNSFYNISQTEGR